MKDRSPWFELHLSVALHRKTYALADALNVERVTALGHIISLWSWALEQAQDGDLSAFTERAVADAAGWRKSPAKLMAGLIAAGYLDADKRLHEWKLYVGPLMDKRQKDRDRRRGSDGASNGNPQGAPSETRTSQTTDDRRQSTTPFSSSSSAVARDAESWFEATTGQPPANEAMRGVLRNIDAAHPADCVTWAFEGSASAREPWPYAKRILDSCLLEGHGPREKRNGPSLGTNGGRRGVRPGDGRGQRGQGEAPSRGDIRSPEEYDRDREAFYARLASSEASDSMGTAAGDVAHDV